MLAKTFFGMEALLADELKALGAQEVRTGTRLVRLKGISVLCIKRIFACERP